MANENLLSKPARSEGYQLRRIISLMQGGLRLYIQPDGGVRIVDRTDGVTTVAAYNGYLTRNVWHDVDTALNAVDMVLRDRGDSSLCQQFDKGTDGTEKMRSLFPGVYGDDDDDMEGLR